MPKRKIDVKFTRGACFSLTCFEGDGAGASVSSGEITECPKVGSDPLATEYQGKMTFRRDVRPGVRETRTVCAEGETVEAVLAQIQLEHDQYYED